MSEQRPASPAAPEWLSALSDGECQPDEVARACAEWRRDAALRARWHAYQLIGDVLRSEDLACAPDRDAAFLGRLRERLQQEPVVLAPVAPPSSMAVPDDLRAVANGASVAVRARRRLWAAPLTMAAGFVAVTALWVGTLHDPAGLPGTAGDGSILAWMSPPQARSADPGVTQAWAPGGASEPVALTVEGSLLRDSELDRYLQAHQQFGSESLLVQPASFLRSAVYEPTSGR